MPLSDLTTPIPRNKQLVQQRRGRIILGVFAFLIALAIGAALFVLPVKSWMKQKDDLATRTSELATLDAANAQLQSEVDRLQTDAGIKEAAREEIDFVEQGEERITMLPPAPLPDHAAARVAVQPVSQIIALRQQDAVAAAAAAQTSVVETVAEPTTVLDATVVETTVSAAADHHRRAVATSRIRRWRTQRSTDPWLTWSSVAVDSSSSIGTPFTTYSIAGM